MKVVVDKNECQTSEAKMFYLTGSALHTSEAKMFYLTGSSTSIYVVIQTLLLMNIFRL